jgi:hypothetical protein
MTKRHGAAFREGPRGRTHVRCTQPGLRIASATTAGG